MPIVRKTIGLLLAIAAVGGFIVGVWMGLVRLGWSLGFPPSVGAHGPLLVLAILGTLIGAERAVAIGKPWVWIGPVTSALAAVTIVAGVSVSVSAFLLIVSGGVLVGVFTSVYLVHPATHIAVMGVGAAAFVASAIVLSLEVATPRVVPLLAAFLVITITGERLELAHLGVDRAGTIWFIVSIVGVGVGSIAAGAGLDAGARLAGVAFLSLALWLGRYDIARRTVRLKGSTRYMAVSLLVGYAWLGIAGLFWLYFGLQPATQGYDTGVHAVFLGFVMSMVFGHSIIVIPVFTNLSFPYHKVMWLPLAFLHMSLVIRAYGDIALSFEIKQWGGMLNTIALALFAGVALVTVVKANTSPSTSRA
ncbi:MAG: hypothetical protein ABFR53_03800 [Actinomycetota bacterium]